MNAGHAYVETIGPRDAGATVLHHLATRHRHSSAAVWAERIEAGQVLVDGRVPVAVMRLRAGQRLVWHRPPWHEPAVPLGYAVLAMDDDLLAVAKPAGLPTAPAGGFLAHTLLRCVRDRHPEATPMHRLGRGTSGIVLFARTERARRALARSWRAGLVERVYRALVTGHPSAADFTVETPIGPVPHPVLGTVHGASAGGRPARTDVHVLDTSGDATLVEVVIATGKPHQIRIHLAAAGHALVGDPLYGHGGLPRPGITALPGDGGYHLHAVRLAFPHPASGLRTVVECAPPLVLRRHW
ncbi:MAG TPA: pseudouridine synthase [Candidatus Binatia bacterium]|nr:pseudouridine synthase [Candidatus Binatia bacterium]